MHIAEVGLRKPTTKMPETMIRRRGAAPAQVKKIREICNVAPTAKIEIAAGSNSLLRELNLTDKSNLAPLVHLRPKQSKPSTDQRFGLKIGFHETALRGTVRAAGGIWRPRQKVWELPYGQIEVLGLADRIAGESDDI